MVIALDVGTSSARAAAYDRRGRRIEGRFHSERYEPVTTSDGGMEHDPARLLEAVARCLDAAVDRVEEIRAVGVSTFWHGLCGFDGSGRVITPVYMWADTRSTADADVLRSALDAEALHARTGCPLHSSYWPAKLRWLMRTDPARTRRVAHWGSFGEYLELTLFGEAATSISMASATGLLDQEAVRWDVEALAVAEIDASRLFALRDRTSPRQGLRTPWARRWPALRSVPWFAAIGDGAAGSIGSGCVSAERIALNVGTSAALRIVTRRPPPPPPGLWRYRIDRETSVIGGATSEGGNVFAWCEATLRLPTGERMEAALAEMTADAHGLTVLPFVAGERSPGWRGNRRAVIAGVTVDTTALDIVRAGLEAVALRLARVYALLAPLATTDHVIVASGGALARSAAWRQIIADVLGYPVRISPEAEATGRGAALLALQALGILSTLEAPLEGETITPDPARHARYQEALARQQQLDAKV
jgi:gluconokinase